MKKLNIAVLSFLFVSLVTEISCALFFTAFKDRFTFHDASSYDIRASWIPKVEKVFDSELGWTQGYDTHFGERPRIKDFGRPLISTFGDSYTHGDQLDHNQTFQTYLAIELNGDVYNFGTGGYGTGQALLRFKRDYLKVKTPIVVLGLTTENINRAVNVYRKFYYQKTALSLPKPRYALENNELTLIENPLVSKQEISRLLEPEFIEALGQNDWWYNVDNYPVLQFPYAKILFNKRLWLETFSGRRPFEVDDIAPRPWENLWELEEPRELMFAIFDEFNRQAKDWGAIPVIMVFPRWRQVLNLTAKETDPAVVTIMEYCKSQEYNCFEGVSGLTEVFLTDNGIFLDDLYQGHLTAEGNRLLARKFYRYLREQDLIPEVPS